MSELRLSQTTVRRHIAFGIQILVHLDLRNAKRIVTEVLHVNGYDAARDAFLLETIYATH